MTVDSVDAASAVHENHRDAIVLLADALPDGKTAQFGSIVAGTSGAPMAQFNRVFVLEEPDVGDLDDAVAWMGEQGDPFWVTVADSVRGAVQELAPDLDLVPIDTTLPGMRYAPLTDLPDPEIVLDVERVTGVSGLDEFVDTMAGAFGIPTDVAAQIMDPDMLDFDDLEFVIGRVDGDGVACGQLVQTGDIAGVYTIGVHEDHRRQGYGEAMSWAVLGLGRDAGCTQATLQSSQMGLPVYEQMGFETVTTYHQFVPESQANQEP